jgi:FkbM family methyltransferase
VINIGPDSVMRVFLDDPYWSRLIASDYEYEPDLARMLRRFLDLKFDFVDCGANFGYWSILLSGSEFGRRRVLAVEASPATFEILRGNCELNQLRFECIHAAVSDRSGKELFVDARRGHSGTQMRESAESNSTISGAVMTIALDDLAPRLGERVVLKLDVEGAEIDSLRGAARLLERDVLVYYEDHGQDLDSRVTQFVLNELGLLVFFADERGEAKPIRSVREASAVKRRRSTGYNFFACNADSAFLPVLRARSR